MLLASLLPPGSGGEHGPVPAFKGGIGPDTGRMIDSRIHSKLECTHRAQTHERACGVRVSIGRATPNRKDIPWRWSRKEDP